MEVIGNENELFLKGAGEDNIKDLCFSEFVIPDIISETEEEAVNRARGVIAMTGAGARHWSIERKKIFCL